MAWTALPSFSSCPHTPAPSAVMLGSWHTVPMPVSSQRPCTAHLFSPICTSEFSQLFVHEFNTCTDRLLGARYCTEDANFHSSNQSIINICGQLVCDLGASYRAENKAAFMGLIVQRTNYVHQLHTMLAECLKKNKTGRDKGCVRKASQFKMGWLGKGSL